MYESANAVAVDPMGFVYVTGEFSGMLNFGGGSLIPNLLDAFVVRLTPAGAYSWARRFGGDGFDSGLAITASSSTIVLAGAYQSSADFGYGAQSSRGSSDGYVVELATGDGRSLWSNGIGGLMMDVVYGVALGTSGHVSVTGSFGDAVDFGAGIDTAVGASDIFVATYAP
jgi:hypothetical protein